MPPMKYRLLASMVAALCLGSCIDGSDGAYGPPPGSGEGHPRCERFTSCATCTPVLGCGWCQSGTKGMCASEPNRCGDAPSFSWTWELAYCPAEPDAGSASGGWTTAPPNGAPADADAPADAGTTTDAPQE
jgi:Plexin repeat